MIQKQHEGQGRAPQSDDLALQVCQPEAQVSQGDGAPNGHEVPVTHARTYARHQEWLGEEWPQPQGMQGMQAMREIQGLAQASVMLAMQPQFFEPFTNSL